MKVSLSDLAKHLGVSQATVSLAINDRPGVSAKTKRKVLEAAEQLGYTPDYFARTLAMQRSHTIGLVVPEIENPFYSKLTQSLESAFRAEGFHLLLGFSDFTLEAELAVITRFLNMRVDSILVSPVHQLATTAAYRKAIEQSPVPILYLASHYDFDCNYIMTDLAAGSFQLTEHLLDSGYEHIVFLSGTDHALLATEREKGFHNAYRSRSLQTDAGQIIRCSHYHYEEAYRIAASLIADGRRPEAIIAINDVMALGVMRAVRNSGLRVPEDIAVAGYDDVIFASIAEVPLTTVRQPIDRLTKAAVESTIALMNESGPSVPIQVRVPPQLIVRRSTLK